MCQSQKHGFTWENHIKEFIFGLPAESNNTDIHDISGEKNTLCPGETISIKTTGGTSIDCGDIRRFYSYEFDNPNIKHTMIVIKYRQQENKKVIEHIFEIDYNKECHQLLFGSIDINHISTYIAQIKQIPPGSVVNEIKNNYLREKHRLQTENNMRINICPKVDSKNQRRVQCSIPNFESILEKFIKYRSPSDSPNLLREKEIPLSIESGKRERNGIRLSELQNIARENNIRGFSTLNKRTLKAVLQTFGLLSKPNQETQDSKPE